MESKTRIAYRLVKDCARQCHMDGTCCWTYGHNCSDFLDGKSAQPCRNAIDAAFEEAPEVLKDVGVYSLDDLLCMLFDLYDR